MKEQAFSFPDMLGLLNPENLVNPVYIFIGLCKRQAFMSAAIF
jgi:hypothetical protein